MRIIDHRCRPTSALSSASSSVVESTSWTSPSPVERSRWDESSTFAVVATVSPAATDAEHSIATLRTVCELAGTSKAADAASDDRGKVVPKLRTDPGVARPRDAPAAPPLPPYPKAWAPTRLAAFFAQKLGLRGAADKVLDVKLDGGMLCAKLAAYYLKPVDGDGDAPPPKRARQQPPASPLAADAGAGWSDFPELPASPGGPLPGLVASWW